MSAPYRAMNYQGAWGLVFIFLAGNIALAAIQIYHFAHPGW